jgi:hypothetical protein
MLPASEIRTLTWFKGEARQAVMAAFNAYLQWRDEISLGNDRCLTKVLDQAAAAQKAQGWPNSVIVAAREHLWKASKVQTQMVDQLMSAWQHQLKSRSKPPDASMLPMRSTTDPMSELIGLGEMTLTRFKICLSAAETWQRTWADAMRSSTDGHLTPAIKSAT